MLSLVLNKTHFNSTAANLIAKLLDYQQPSKFYLQRSCQTEVQREGSSMESNLNHTDRHDPLIPPKK